MWAATAAIKLLVAHYFEFQSTRPVWAATYDGKKWHVTQPLSIHAARVGRDTQTLSHRLNYKRFQSTRPVWAATSDNLL